MNLRIYEAQFWVYFSISTIKGRDYVFPLKTFQFQLFLLLNIHLNTAEILKCLIKLLCHDQIHKDHVT